MEKSLVATLMFEIDNPLSRGAFLGKVGGIEEKIFLKIDSEELKQYQKRCRQNIFRRKSFFSTIYSFSF